MVDIMQNPQSLNVGCILGEQIKVDHAFRNKESFKWEEFEFTVVHSLGHGRPFLIDRGTALNFESCLGKKRPWKSGYATIVCEGCRFKLRLFYRTAGAVRLHKFR